jgi:L-ascorbate metabolism protein UlaG (beta-lactamase superfamily)
MMPGPLRCALWLGLALAFPAALAAQERIPSHCIALARDGGPERVVPAGFGAPLAADHVRIRYVDHATFLLETPGGLLAATDYTGYLGLADVVPDVVTMNNAHHTHWTATPDPRIPHVLKGWPEAGVAPQHELDLSELLVRNVSTDTRGPFGEGARANGNSIFLFEVAGLCIGHLGHLHHEPTPEQYAAIGRVDVLMVPVDGGYTMSIEAMRNVVRKLRSSVVLPMHWFSGASLEVFLQEMSGEFDVVRLEQPDLELSLGDLPGRPTIMVLQPAFLP